MILPNISPQKIVRADTGLSIEWNDGTKGEIPAKILREMCPCAECREKRGDTSHAAPLTTKKRSLSILSASLKDELSLDRIWGVGTYALGLEWGDGHNTGIYTFQLLRELGVSGG